MGSLEKRCLYKSHVSGRVGHGGDYFAGQETKAQSGGKRLNW